jgi:hypothetical protein
MTASLPARRTTLRGIPLPVPARDRCHFLVVARPRIEVVAIHGRVISSYVAKSLEQAYSDVAILNAGGRLQ